MPPKVADIPTDCSAECTVCTSPNDTPILTRKQATGISVNSGQMKPSNFNLLALPPDPENNVIVNADPISTTTTEEEKLEEDDDHEEFSRYLLQEQLKKSLARFRRCVINTIYRRSRVLCQILSVSAVAWILAYVYAQMPEAIDSGLDAARDGVRQTLEFSANYGMHALFVAFFLAIGLAIKYYTERYFLQAAEYERLITHMMKEALGRIRLGGFSGVPIKMLRDTIVPVDKRTKTDLDAWNQVESIIRFDDTRVHIEERVINDDEAIVEYFVWAASSRIGLEDECESADESQS